MRYTEKVPLPATVKSNYSIHVFRGLAINVEYKRQLFY